MTVPDIVVDAGLPVGRHRFRLRVVTVSGLSSQPTEVEVSIIDRAPDVTGPGHGVSRPTKRY